MSDVQLTIVTVNSEKINAYSLLTKVRIHFSGNFSVSLEGGVGLHMGTCKHIWIK